MYKKYSCTLILLFLILSNCKDKKPLVDFETQFNSIPKSELLMLGTFHFRDPGRDSFKSKSFINIISPEKQRELDVVLKAIERFNPTKITVEYPKARQYKLDSLYKAYLNGTYQLGANEVYQVGFKLAKRLGHKKIYAIDVRGRSFYSQMSDEVFEKKEKEMWNMKNKKLRERARLIDSLYYDLYRAESRLKTQYPLIDVYLQMNNEERNKMGHGIYLNGNFRISEGNDYFGPDSVTRWYNRNVRMFHNIANINNLGEDRIFLIVGKGHLSLLNFLADASLDFDRRKFLDFVYEK